MTFTTFQKAIETKFSQMEKHPLYKVDLSKNDLWDTYLNSFPPGTNLIYKERTEHDCQCCKQFIRTMGNVVMIHNNKLISIWDTTIDDPTYQAVADKMAELVRSAPIKHPFYHYEKTAGTRQSHSQEEDGQIKTWDHFHLTLPAAVFMAKDAIATRISTLQSSKEVFQRSLKEITPEALDTVLELIEQKSLYRGEEHVEVLSQFKTVQRNYNSMKPLDQEKFAWETAHSNFQGLLRMRNTSIGTLLVDLSEGKELDHAVRAFETMVAPANYKRPTALITPSMIKKAQETVEALGFTEALQRRHAVPEDVTINNVLFANRDARKAMGGSVFDELLESQPINPQSLSKVEEIGIEEFIAKIVPKASKIELLLENSKTPNLMSLIAPVHPDSPNMLQWENNFSWSYTGDVTDSEIRKAVQARGGKVDGVFRFSHSWNHPNQRNASLMDLHVFLPQHNEPHIEHQDGIHDYYGNDARVGWNRRKHPATQGVQDVDYTQPAPTGYIPVENITFPNLHTMPEGVYTCKIHNWQKRTPNQGGFQAEIEFGGNIFQYEVTRPLKDKEWITVAKVTLSKGAFTIEHCLPAQTSSKEIWNLQSMQYHNVSMMLYSPNHWNGKSQGNKHYFFILEGCKQPGEVRGFYNEFLTDKLRDHRKVFEVLGNKLKAPESDVQLSGLGFSSTQRNHVFCRVSGSFNRIVKITF